MKTQLFLGLCGLLLCSACEKKSDLPAGQYELSFGEKIELNGTEVEFYAVQDSRCPWDAICVWEGEAEVSLRLYQQEEIAAEFTLTYAGLCSEDCGSSEKVLGRQYTLLGVSPYPGLTNMPIPEGDYVIVLKVD